MSKNGILTQKSPIRKTDNIDMRLPGDPVQTPVLLAVVVWIPLPVFALWIDDSLLLTLPRFFLGLDQWAALLPLGWLIAYFAAVLWLERKRARGSALLNSLRMASLWERRAAPSRTFPAVLGLLKARKGRQYLILQIVPGFALSLIVWRFLDLHSPGLTAAQAFSAALAWVIGYSAVGFGGRSRAVRQPILSSIWRLRSAWKRDRRQVMAAVVGLSFSILITVLALLGSHGVLLPGLARISIPEEKWPPTQQGGGFADGQLDLSNRHLEGAGLPGVRWAGAVITGVSLRGADLRGADLSGIHTLLTQGNDVACTQLPGERKNAVDFAGADLRGATLVGADLRCANLEGATLDGANFEDANLMEANMRGVQAHGVKLSGANLGSAQLDKADLSYSILNGADLQAVSMKSTLLIRAKLQMAALIEADLSGADLSDADLSGAMMIDTSLKNATLLRTDLRAATQLRIDAGKGSISRHLDASNHWSRILCQDYFADRAAVSELPDFVPRTGPERLVWAQVKQRRDQMRRYLKEKCMDSRLELSGQLQPEVLLESTPVEDGAVFTP